jgi:tetratricopeptide (TPR) repeat protein
VKVLTPLIEQHPRDADLIAQLAETELNLGNLVEAQAHVDQALGLRPQFPRALYVRARAFEADGDVNAATENYQFALRSDPTFAPALSRLWRIYRDRAEKVEAMAALERLFFMGDASLEEKVALAEMYADSRTHLDRGHKLIAEALRREPTNARYKEVKARLGKQPGHSGKPGIIIMKGHRR